MYLYRLHKYGLPSIAIQFVENESKNYNPMGEKKQDNAINKAHKGGTKCLSNCMFCLVH